MEPDEDSLLLHRAFKMQQNLCNFKNEWEGFYNADLAEARYKQPPGQIDEDQLKWLKSVHYPQEAAKYENLFMADAKDLRISLMREVPGVASTFIDYSNVRIPDNIDDVFEDFRALTVAFNTKVKSGSYTQAPAPFLPRTSQDPSISPCPLNPGVQK